MKNLLLLLFLACISYCSYAQCSNISIKEAVRNGDFEAGYLIGTGTKHTFTIGDHLDFHNDLNFAGNVPNYPIDGCKYGIGDQYMVLKAENFTCGGTEHINSTYWGVSYGGDKNFQDHTTKLKGKGYALVMDLNQQILGTGANGKPIAWGQTMSIIPNQSYWFSAWIANFSNGISPQMQVTISPWIGGAIVTDDIVTLPITTQPAGLMNWTQISQNWTPNKAYEKVTVNLEIVNSASGNAGLDIAIDDISFINSCQNIEMMVDYMPSFDKENISICHNEGFINLTLQDNQGNPFNSSQKVITWYEGNENLQQEISSFNGSVSPKVNAKGTYRVCVQDPNNNCNAVSATIQVTEDLAIQNIPENIILCSPSQKELNADLGYKNIVYSWTGPIQIDTSYININQGGNYNISANLPGFPNCTASQTVIVTSNLPTAPTELKYCGKGGLSTQLIGPNTTQEWRWCEDASCSTIIGSGTSVEWTPAINTTGNQILYMQNAESTDAGTVGPNSVISYPAGSTGITTKFTTYQNISLQSVKVYAVTWTGGCNSSSSTYDYTFSIPELELSKVVSVNCGQTNTINLNFNVPAGGPYTLQVTGGNPFRYGNITNNKIENIIEITENGNTVFSNWKIVTSQACDPIPVTIKENCVISSNNEVTNNDIKIVPNPFENETTISVNTSSSIIVYDVNGKIVEAFNNVSEVIVGNDLITGIYFVSIQNENGVFYQKIVKQ